jgi:hypothetical protein
MRGLMVAVVVVMGLLIFAGMATIGLTIVHRILAVPPAPPAAWNVMLDEPAGTRIALVSALADRLALRLEGGGPDRVVVVDMQTGRVLGRAGLAK